MADIDELLRNIGPEVQQGNFGGPNMQSLLKYFNSNPIHSSNRIDLMKGMIAVKPDIKLHASNIPSPEGESVGKTFLKEKTNIPFKTGSGELIDFSIPGTDKHIGFPIKSLRKPSTISSAYERTGNIDFTSPIYMSSPAIFQENGDSLNLIHTGSIGNFEPNYNVVSNGLPLNQKDAAALNKIANNSQAFKKVLNDRSNQLAGRSESRIDLDFDKFNLGDMPNNVFEDMSKIVNSSKSATSLTSFQQALEELNNEEGPKNWDEVFKTLKKHIKSYNNSGATVKQTIKNGKTSATSAEPTVVNPNVSSDTAKPPEANSNSGAKPVEVTSNKKQFQQPKPNTGEGVNVDQTPISVNATPMAPGKSDNYNGITLDAKVEPIPSSAPNSSSSSGNAPSSEASKNNNTTPGDQTAQPNTKPGETTQQAGKDVPKDGGSTPSGTTENKPAGAVHAQGKVEPKPSPPILETNTPIVSETTEDAAKQAAKGAKEDGEKLLTKLSHHKGLIAAGAVGVAAMGGLVLGLNYLRGRQTNAQLYGQRPIEY